MFAASVAAWYGSSRSSHAEAPITTDPATDADLIDAFLEAIRTRNLEQAMVLHARLGQRAEAVAALRPWHDYFRGILANERDHDLAAAERIFLGVLDASPRPAPDLAARLCIALGLTYRRQGRLAECIAACERSLPVYAQLNDPVGQAKALKQIVVAYVAGYDQAIFGAEVLPVALAHTRQALQALDDVPATDETRWLAGTLWNEVGALQRNLGDFEQAVAAYRRFLAYSETANYSLGIGMASGNLGEIYLNQGPASWPAAETALARSLALAHEAGDRINEIEAWVNLAYLSQQQGDLITANERYAEAICSIMALRAGISSEAGRTGFFATTTETFANAILAAVAANRQAYAFDLAEQARARSFLDRLSAAPDEIYPRFDTQSLNLAQVQAVLRDEDLLLVYFTTGLVDAPAHQERGQGSRRHRFPPAHSLVFAITRTGLRVHDLGVSPNDLRPTQLTAAIERHFLDDRLRRTLYERLIGPVADLLVDRRRLYLVPHGPLHYVPFQALIAPDGEPLLRGDGPELIYGPSASVLFGRSAPCAADATARTPCLAVGHNGEGPDALRYAEEEAERIVALVGGQALTNSAADGAHGTRRAALFDLAPDVRYLHISCHGAFDPEQPLGSSLRLGKDESLTALEVIQGLRLRCDLVTLSACESGLSRVGRGDELMGLVRAFMVAGAPAVIATQWRVDERSTRILMERLYGEVAAGVGFAQALQHAQIYLRSLSGSAARSLLEGELPAGADPSQPFAGPVYWAPFILIGAQRAAGPGDLGTEADGD